MPSSIFRVRLFPLQDKHEGIVRAYQRTLIDHPVRLSTRISRGYIIDTALRWLIENYRSVLTADRIREMRNSYMIEVLDHPMQETTINPSDETFNDLRVVADYILESKVNIQDFVKNNPRQRYKYNITILIYMALWLYAEHLLSLHPALQPELLGD